MAGSRDSRGRFTGGGDSVGGIEATVSVDDSGVVPGIARVETALTGLERRFVTTATASQQLSVGSTAATASTKQFGNTVLYASNALQDFSAAGMRGVTNNLPQLVASLGGGAGLAGAIMLVGLGIELLGPKIGQFFDQFRDSPVETAAQEMDRLGKATHKTADEQERLNKLKKEAKQDEQQKSARPEAEKSKGAAFGKALSEGPIEEVEAKLAKQLRPAARPVTEDDIEEVVGPERMAALRASRGAVGLAPGRTEEVRKNLEIEHEKQASASGEAEARRILREAQFGVGGVGDAARKRLQGLVAANPTLPDQFRRNIDAAAAGREVLSPEARREALEKQLEKDVKKEEAGGKTDIDGYQKARGENMDRVAAEEKAARDANRTMQDQAETTRQEEERGKAEAREVVKQEQDRLDLLALENPLRGKFGAKDAERGSDLDWRMRNLLNPEKVGQSMGIDAYEASIKATSGVSEQEKQAHALQELREEYAKNRVVLDKLSNMRVIGTRKP